MDDYNMALYSSQMTRCIRTEIEDGQERMRGYGHDDLE